MILTVEAHNFKIHKDLKIDLNKESAIVIGDSGKGKSSFMQIILAHISQVPYPNNPLTEGADEGWTKTTHEVEGKGVYTISRKFKRGADGAVVLDRFEVRGPDGYKKSLEQVMKTVFQGAFTHSRFDYVEYFHKQKSPEARYQYFVNAIGGATIEANDAKIEEKEKERAIKGAERKTQLALWEQVTTSEDTVEKDIAFYSQERTPKEADDVKQAIIDKIKYSSPERDKIAAHKVAKAIINTENTSIDNDLENISSLKQQIAALQEKLTQSEQSLEKRRAVVKEQEKHVLSDVKMAALENKVKKQDDEIERLEQEAVKAYNDKIQELVDFGSAKKNFFDGIRAFKLWKELDQEWNKIDQEIKDIKAESEKALKKLLPLPELSIGELKEKPIVLYDGREFSANNLSTGEAIKITAAIQLALNPKGDNFIVIPQAQSLGSKLKEIMEACQKMNVQFLVEMTLPDEEFRVEVIEPGVTEQ